MDGNTAQYATPLLTSCTVQSLSVHDYLGKHTQGLDPSFETLVINMIITELDNWTTDFCFLYFYCVEKVYITISDRYSDILQKNVGKRKRVYLEGLGLTPYKPQTKEKKEGQDKDKYKCTVRYPSSINLSSFIKTPVLIRLSKQPTSLRC